jgi:diguanylate cyclase (GGDEF)-like protein
MNAVNHFMNEIDTEKEEMLLLLRETAGAVAYYQRLLERFELDSLTGLSGSNKFSDFIKDIEARASSVGVIFFDVNGLKFYNDNHGHKAGDLLLQKAAESILYISGDNIKTFRTGGDEFVAVITKCTECYINEVLEKWRNKLAELNSKDDNIYCSIAAGSAFAEEPYRINDVLALADERMYADKKRIKAEGLPFLPDGIAPR